jgi:tripartite-type tricarboxylate transporter receptor subunit TctC
MPRVVTALLACTAIATACPSVTAEEFPSRPITFIIGLAAGGFTDTSARSYADAITQREGWKIVIDNRAGAGGGIAAAAVQNARSTKSRVASGLRQKTSPMWNQPPRNTSA